MSTEQDEIRQMAIKEALAFLRDPETYVVRPGDEMVGPWMEDGLKLAGMLESKLLGDPLELSLEQRAQYVRRAAVAANITTVAFPPPHDGNLQAMFWNATDDTILCEGTVEDEPMPGGERTRVQVSFTIGFGLTATGGENHG